jgi:hypothetical protein
VLISYVNREAPVVRRRRVAGWDEQLAFDNWRLSKPRI